MPQMDLVVPVFDPFSLGLSRLNGYAFDIGQTKHVKSTKQDRTFAVPVKLMLLCAVLWTNNLHVIL